MKCSNCVLEEIPGLIVFDEKGVCNQCREHVNLTYEGEEEFLRQVKAAKNKGSRYDCAVALSGGRDSSYILLKLVKDYKLKVLAINYENPMTHPIARANIENAVRILGVDLVSYKVKNHAHERSFKENVTAWFDKPDPAMVPMMCIACKTMWYHFLKITRKNKVTCIISGENPLEETSFKKELLDVSHDTPKDSTFLKSTKGVVKGLIRNPRYLRHRYYPLMAVGWLFADPTALGSRLYGMNIKRLHLFNYIPWSEKEVISRITNELEWRYPEGQSTWRFDCKVELIKNLMYMMTVGMNEKDDFYSMMIREGMITRDQALEYLKLEDNIHWDKVVEFLRKQGIEDIDHIERAILASPKLSPTIRGQIESLRVGGPEKKAEELSEHQTSTRPQTS